MKPPALRRLPGRLALLAGGLLAGLLLAEVAARLLQPDAAADLLFNAPDNAPLGLHCTDRELISRPCPGFSGVDASLGYRVRIRVNALGLRGPEPGPASGARWLATGDSFTFAAQVDEDDTFVARLGARTGIEFWNAGSDGYGTWQATIRYRRLDGRLGVEGVLHTFFLGNDFTDDRLFPVLREQVRRSGRADGTPIPREPAPAWRRFLSRHSYLWGRLQMRRRTAELSRPDSPERGRWRSELAPFTRSGAGELRALLPETRRALAELRDETRRRGDRLLVAVAPPAFVVDETRLAATFALVGLDPADADPDAPGRAALGLLADLGVEACDLTPALRAARAAGERVYFTYDGHWTPAGHRVVAETVAACLR